MTERAAWYRTKATEARALAESTKDSLIKHDLLQVARQWDDLAVHAETTLRNST